VNPRNLPLTGFSICIIIYAISPIPGMYRVSFQSINWYSYWYYLHSIDYVLPDERTTRHFLLVQPINIRLDWRIHKGYPYASIQPTQDSTLRRNDFPFSYVFLRKSGEFILIFKERKEGRQGSLKNSCWGCFAFGLQ